MKNKIQRKIDRKILLRCSLLAGAAVLALPGLSSPALSQETTSTAPTVNIDANSTLQNFTVEDDVGIALSIDTDVDFTVDHDVEQTDIGLDGPDSGTIELQGTGGAETNLGLTISAGATASTSVSNTGAVIFSVSGADVNIANGITINGVVDNNGAGAAIDLSDANRDSATTITINGDGGGADGDVTGAILLGDNATASDTLILNDDAVLAGAVTGGDGDQLLSFTGVGGSTLTGDVDLGAGTADRILANLTDADDTGTISGAISNVEDIDVVSGILVLDGLVDNTNSAVTIFDDATLRVGASGDVQVDVTNETGEDGTQIIDVENGGVLGAAGTTVDLGAGDDAITMDGGTISAGNLIGGDGTDTITISGNNAVIESDVSGFETLTVNSSDTLSLGSGGNTDISDTPSVLLQGDGSTLEVNTTGTIIASVGVGAGSGATQEQNMTLTAGSFEGDVSLGDGVDIVTVTAGTFGRADRTNTLNLGLGNDEVLLNGGILYSRVVGGGGTDLITVGANATLASSVTLGTNIEIDDGLTLTIDSGALTVASVISEVNNGANQSVILSSGTLSGNIELGNGNNSLTVNGGAFTGEYTGGINDDTININLATPSSTFDLGRVAFTAGGTDILTLTQGAVNVTDLVTGDADITLVANNSSMYLEAASTLDGTNFTANTGTALTFELTDTTVFGNIAADGNAVITDNAVNIRVTNDAVISNGDTFDLITSAGGVTDLQLTTLSDISALLSFDNTSSDADNLQVTAIVADIGDIVAQQNQAHFSALADEVLAIPAGTDADIDVLRGLLLSAQTDEAVAQIIESTGPTLDRGAMVATMEIANQVSGSVNRQLDILRGDLESGIAYGNGSLDDDLRFWLQTFGTIGDQDTRENIDGFNFQTYGVTAGFDTQNAAEDLTLGFALSYADTGIDSDNINNTEINMRSYLISLYGEYGLGDDYFVGGQVSGGFNDVHQARINTAGGSLIATSDYSSNQYQIYAETGRQMSWDNGVNFTPVVLADYKAVTSSGYTESGVGGVGLNVNYDTVSQLELGLGAQLSRDVVVNTGVFTPYVELEYRHDVIDERMGADVSFIGGGSTFQLEGYDPAESRFVFGTGFTYLERDHWEVSADYQYKGRSGYAGHSGMMKAAYRF